MKSSFFLTESFGLCLRKKIFALLNFSTPFFVNVFSTEFIIFSLLFINNNSSQTSEIQEIGTGIFLEFLDVIKSFILNPSFITILWISSYDKDMLVNYP